MQPRHIQAHTYGTRAPHIRTIKQIRVRSFQCARAIVLHFSFFFRLQFFFSVVSMKWAGESSCRWNGNFRWGFRKVTSIERIGWHLFALCQFLSSAHKAFIYVWHRASQIKLPMHLSFGRRSPRRKERNMWRR